MLVTCQGFIMATFVLKCDTYSLKVITSITSFFLFVKITFATTSSYVCPKYSNQFPVHMTDSYIEAFIPFELK